MKVLITGGAGFLGSHLCDFFLANNYEVICKYLSKIIFRTFPLHILISKMQLIRYSDKMKKGSLYYIRESPIV